MWDFFLADTFKCRILGQLVPLILDIWWHALWVSKPKWVVTYLHCGGKCDVHFLRSTSGATPANLLPDRQHCRASTRFILPRDITGTSEARTRNHVTMSSLFVEANVMCERDLDLLLSGQECKSIIRLLYSFRRQRWKLNRFLRDQLSGPTSADLPTPGPHHQCFIEYLDLQIKVTEFYSNFPPCFSLLNIHLLALYSHVWFEISIYHKQMNSCRFWSCWQNIKIYSYTLKKSSYTLIIKSKYYIDL